MKFTNPAELSEKEFAELETELAKYNTLGEILTWANSKAKNDFLPQIVGEVV